MFQGDEAEFWESRPTPTDRQRELLHCYYKARRDAKSDSKVTAKEFESYLFGVNYETDIAVTILQKLDDHYLKLCADKLKRKSDGR